jgi:hypothetical protein
MNNYQSIADAIIDTYSKNLFSFRQRYQYHFGLRVWRVRKDERFLHPIFVDFQLKTLKFFPRLISFKKGVSAKEIGEEALANYSESTPKKAERKRVYEKIPQALFFQGLIHYLFLTKTYKLEDAELIGKEYGFATNHLKNAKLKDYLFNDSYLRVNPSGVANTVYYLKYLEVKDLESELLDIYEDYWLTLEPETEFEWQKKIYALTHLIIAGSYFYQRILDGENHSWILDYFEENIDDILANTNEDIITEVGLCFKLCGKEGGNAYNKARKFIVSRFDEKKGYIPKETNPDSLEKAEHRNAVAVLLLSNFAKTNDGPNLKLFSKEKRLALYLPKRALKIGFSSEED